MKLTYDRETDSLYIDLVNRPNVDRCEVMEGIVLGFDAEGRLVGIDIDHASRKVELPRLVPEAKG